MKTIELTRGMAAIVDDDDFEALSKLSWYAMPRGYAVHGDRSSGKLKIIYMHRYLMNPGAGMVVDHINGNKLDNRRCNLRVCTPSQNSQNKKPQKNNALGVKGVCKDTKRDVYRSSIKVGDKIVFLGYSDTIEEASRKYREASDMYFGEFSYTAYKDVTSV